MKFLHISLKTVHSGCKPSTFMSSSTHSFQVSLFLPYFSPLPPPPFYRPTPNHPHQWRQFKNFLGGKIFYGVGENFFCAVMPKAPYQHPLLKSIHVLKCTKAWYACTYIEHWINESNKKKNFWESWGGDGPQPPQLAPLIPTPMLQISNVESGMGTRNHPHSRTQCFVPITAATAVIRLKLSPSPRLPRFYRGNQC